MTPATLYATSGTCHWCKPTPTGVQDTICHDHLLELLEESTRGVVDCDVCVPRADERLTALCPAHLRELNTTRGAA